MVLAGSGGASAFVYPTLYVAYVGTNCTFTITGDTGANVTSIAPGTYQIVLTAEDFSSCPSGLPDFLLTGPGVSIETPIDAGTGAAAEYTVTFQPGSTYVALDRNQPVLSRIAFTTQTSGTPIIVSPPTSTPKPAAGSPSTDVVGSAVSSKPKAAVFRGTLLGTVSATGSSILTFEGKNVGQLVAGKYTVSVSDKSHSAGLVIQQLERSATTLTTAPFVGKRSVTIVLQPGQSLFYPTFVGKKTYFLVVAAH